MIYIEIKLLRFCYALYENVLQFLKKENMTNMWSSLSRMHIQDRESSKNKILIT